jgi:hypothetical protein
MRFPRLMGLLALAACAISAPATAQVIATNPGYIPNQAFEGVANLSNTAYTNATTTATILPGTALTVPATQFDPAGRLIQVCYSADVTKATSGTGAVGVAQDGVPIVASYRFSGFNGGRSVVANCYAFFRASQAATVISLYAVSSDTASFAVQNAQMIVTQWQLIGR